MRLSCVAAASRPILFIKQQRAQWTHTPCINCPFLVRLVSSTKKSSYALFWSIQGLCLRFQIQTKNCKKKADHVSKKTSLHFTNFGVVLLHIYLVRLTVRLTFCASLFSFYVFQYRLFMVSFTFIILSATSKVFCILFLTTYLLFECHFIHVFVFLLLLFLFLHFSAKNFFLRKMFAEVYVPS